MIFSPISLESCKPVGKKKHVNKWVKSSALKQVNVSKNQAVVTEPITHA